MWLSDFKNYLLAIHSVILLLPLVYGQTCTCDLITGLCEVNCCCDRDCSTDDMQTFNSSLCAETTFDTVDQLCAYDQVVFVNNIQATNQVRENDQYCIEYDNFASKNYYVNPICIQSNSCFDTVGALSSTEDGEITQSQSSFYKSGDKIYVMYQNAKSLFALPTTSVSGLCQNYNPVDYLFPQNNVCARAFPSLATSFCSDASLDYASYIMQIFQHPLINETIPPLVEVAATCSKNGAVQNCVSPSMSGSVCENVTTSVTYTLITSGTDGVTEADVIFILQDIVDTDLPLLQSFSVNFQAVQNTGPFTVLSGNPGYLVGKPLLAAACDGAVTVCEAVELSLIMPDTSGVCSSSQPRMPVVFGQDIRTGCKVTIGTLTCTQLQNAILQFLKDKAFDVNALLYAGSFGNSNMQELIAGNTAKWVLVDKGSNSSNPRNVSTGCSEMILSARYDILYAYDGSVTDPQAKVVGVRYIYGTPEFLRFQCQGGNCLSRSTDQTVEIFTSVNFVDVSETPVSLQQERPTYESKLPVSFFFPLTSSTAFTQSSFILLPCLFYTVLNLA